MRSKLDTLVLQILFLKLNALLKDMMEIFTGIEIKVNDVLSHLT